MLTQTRTVFAFSVGQTSAFYVDVDPSDLEESESLLDGRTISSIGTPVILDSRPGTISLVNVVASPVEINGETIATGTGFYFTATGFTVRTDGKEETLVKFPLTLSGGGDIVPINVRFKVEP